MLITLYTAALFFAVVAMAGYPLAGAISIVLFVSACGIWWMEDQR